jgi:hypothetical protein
VTGQLEGTLGKHTEAYVALSKALRPVIAELVCDYQTAVASLDRGARRNLDRETLKKLEGLRARRHYELALLVPCARHLRIHLQQERAGFAKTPIERTGGPLIAVLLGLALQQDPVSEYHSIWAVPVDGRLVESVILDLLTLRQQPVAEMWVASDPEMQMLQCLHGSTLGQLRDSYRAYAKLAEPKAASPSKSEKLEAFIAIRDRLQAMLTPEEYLLLREFGGRL